MELVFLKPYRLDSQRFLMPGDEVPPNMRAFQKRSLYQRRIVGCVDDPWALDQIERSEAKAARNSPKPEITQNEVMDEVPSSVPTEVIGGDPVERTPISESQKATLDSMGFNE